MIERYRIMNKLEHLPREKPKMLGDLNKGELFVFCNPPKELPVTWTSILEVVEVEGVDESRAFTTLVLNPTLGEVKRFDSLLAVKPLTYGVDSETEWYE